MKHVLFYPIFLIIYFFFLFLSTRGCFNSTESLYLIDIINVFELGMIVHFLFVLIFEKDGRIKLTVFALLVYSIAIIVVTVGKFNPF